MRLSSLLCFASLALASPLQPANNPAPREAKANYDGYHVYSITPSSASEAHELSKRFERHHTQPIRDTLSVAIPPSELETFHSLKLKARLVNSDLGAYIRSTEAKQRPSYAKNSPLRKRGELPDLSWFDSYHDYEDHLTFWDDLVEAFPRNSEKLEIGRSWENRSIHAFHLFGDEEGKGTKGYGKGGRKGEGEDENEDEDEKPVILWHATVHAREVNCLVLAATLHVLC